MRNKRNNKVGLFCSSLITHHSLLTFTFLLLSGCSSERPWDAPPPPSWPAFAAFEERFKAEDYAGVIEIARVNRHEKIRERERVLFLLAESHRRLGQTYKACRRYVDLVEEFPQPAESETVAGSLYEIASEHLRKGKRKVRLPNTHRTVSVQKLLENSIQCAPYGAFSARARLLLADLSVKSGEPERAARLYEQVYLRQSADPAAQEALWNAATMHRNLYRGRHYDAEPILKAEMEAVEYLARYPGGEHRPQMEQLCSEIRLLQRERLEPLRRFYAKQKNAAAVEQYGKLIREMERGKGFTDGTAQ